MGSRCGQSLAATSSYDVTTSADASVSSRTERPRGQRTPASTHFVFRSPSIAFAAPWPSGPSPLIARADAIFSCRRPAYSRASEICTPNASGSLAARMPENSRRNVWYAGGGAASVARGGSGAASSSSGSCGGRTSAPPARHALSSVDAFRVRGT